MLPTKEELALAVDEAEWDWLRAHLERGGLIVVASELDLVEAGLKVASNNAVAIQGWIKAGRLAKPSLKQIAEWDNNKGKRFLSLIVSPFVLIQEIL